MKHRDLRSNVDIWSVTRGSNVFRRRQRNTRHGNLLLTREKAVSTIPTPVAYLMRCDAEAADPRRESCHGYEEQLREGSGHKIRGKRRHKRAEAR